MAKNVQGVIFLRNNNPYASREAALTGIESKKSLVGDGQFILARYNATENNATVVKTLVGVNAGDGANGYLTIIDVEGSSADVEALRQEINAKLGTTFISSGNTVEANLTALSGNGQSTSAETSVEGAKRYADELKNQMDYTGVTTGDGVYVTNVTQSDGIVSATTATLPTVETITVAGKPIIAVAEDKGQIAASAGTINAEYVNIADSGDKFTATTVEGALAELDGKITDAIDGLDYTGVTTGTGVYVTNVTEEDGKVSATTATLPTVNDTAVAKNFVIAVDETLGEISVERGSITSSAKTIVLNDNTDGGIDFDVNIDNSTIVKDENTGVISVASAALTQYVGDGKTIEISAADEHNNKTVSTLLTLSSVTPSSTTVKEEYALKNASGETIGSTIKIYKDSSLVSIELVNEDPTQDPPKAGQFLKYTYIDASGATQSVYVDVSALLVEAEFESGVTANDAGVVHGVVDPTSESFLTVGENGFKISGVSGLVENAINALDATGGTQTIATGKHVAVEVVEENGKITAVTVAEDNIADADDLAQEILDREAGDTALSNRLGEGVTSANTAAAQLAALSGNGSSTSAETSVEGAKRYADAKLADVVGGLDATVTGATSGNHVTITIDEVDGKLTQSGLTIEENDIASATDLAELSGKTITAITSTNGSISASISNEAGNKTADIQTDADKIQMSGFSADNTSALSGIAESDSIATAFEKTNAVITENERVTAGALNDLDGRLDVIESGYVETVKVNNVALAETDNAVNVKISAATSVPTATVNDPAIVVNTDNTGAITLGIGYIDCGTYDDPQS